jgi:hypothetical protein
MSIGMLIKIKVLFGMSGGPGAFVVCHAELLNISFQPKKKKLIS